MPSLVIVGTQWGDEGKGKIVDHIAAQADVVARYQGGSNAGHTVVDGKKKYVLHLIPSGILHAQCRCLIGNGLVVDPEALSGEIAELEGLGIDIDDRLMIADTAHLVLPYHKALDKAQEKLRGKGKIGTTGRGIGCAYGDKATRTGLRAGDLRSEDGVRAKLSALADFYGPMFEHVYHEALPTVDEVADVLLQSAAKLVPMLVDGPAWINEQVATGRRVLIEGAQGVLLDIDHGTYPYVTSSNPTPGGVCTGLGLSPKRIDRIAGVTKAYTTRVGEGPLPTEFDEVFGAQVREAGNEYGATTGRPRRCGWFDAPAVRRSILIGGIDEILLTKIDVLDALETIRICTGYRIAGREYDVMPSSLDADTPVEPIYEDLPGWQEPLTECRSWADLPERARAYIERLEQLLEVPASIVSVSPDREGTILRGAGFFG